MSTKNRLLFALLALPQRRKFNPKIMLQFHPKGGPLKTYGFQVFPMLLIALLAAAPAWGFDIRPEDVAANPGDTISIPVRIENVANSFEMDAIGFSLPFDADSFDWVEVDAAGTLTDGFTLLAGQEIETGLVKVVGALFGQEVLVSGDDVLLNLRFTVADGASGDFTFGLIEFKDDIAAATTSPATVSISGDEPDDTTPPVISLIGDATVTVEQNSGFTDPGATATDDVDGDISDQIDVAGAVDTDTPGTYTLTYSVSDAAGNAAAHVTRTVVVTEDPAVDTTPPVISLIGDATITVEQNSGFTDPGATATDDVDGDISDQIDVAGAVDTATPGTYTLTYSVSDAAGNAAAHVTRTVVVTEDPALPPTPMMACIGGTLTLDGQTLSPSEAGEYTIRVVRLDGSEYMPRAETQGLNDLGWYSINIPVYDEITQPGGAIPGETGVIEIRFEGAPIAKIVEPEKAWVTVGESASVTILDIAAELQTQVDVRPSNISAAAGDAVNLPITIRVNGAPLEMDAIGLTLTYDTADLTYAGVAPAGTLTQDFTHLDGRETTPGAVKIVGALFDDPVMVQGTETLIRLAFSVKDGAAGDSAMTLSDFKDDIAGATTADAVFSAKSPPTPPTPPSPPVTDTVPPVVTLVGEAEISIPAGGSFVDPGATASDNRDGDISDRIVVEGAVDTATPGTYTLTYSVSDAAGNAAAPVTRTVVVTEDPAADTTPPVISLIGDATITLEAGETFTDPGAAATDDVDGDISDQIDVAGAVDTDTPGIYTLTYTVRDTAGNAAEPATRDVVVTPPVGVDTTPPVISLIGDATITLEAGETFTDPGAAATDDVDGDISDQIDVAGAVDTDTPGTYTLTYSVSDAAGNAAAPVTRTVVVTEDPAADTTPPELTVDATDVVEIPPGGMFTPPAAGAVDDADGDLSGQIQIAGTVDPLTPGTYTLIYSVTDAAGNAADPAEVQIVVTDSEAAADLSAATGSLTTFRSVDLPETGRIPFDLVLRPGGSDTSPVLRLAAGTVVLTASDAPFGGILPAPVRTEPSPSIQAELGPDVATFRLADSDTPLFLSGASPGWLTVTVVLPEGAADPTLWRTDPGGGVSPAGLEGEMDGIAVFEGGTVIERAADTPEPGRVAVTLVALVDELGTYAVGVRSEADGGGGGGCFIDAAAK